jgi:acetyl esterase/lipase
MTRSEFLFHIIDKGLHPIQNYRRFKNIVKEAEFVYDENYPDDCTGEFYYDPELIKTETLPVVVNIHGGGFVKGDKKHRTSLCGVYANKGYFVLNINYRLSPKSKFPAGVQDAVKAINYLDTVKDKYNIDLGKVVVTGDSSGAYYATMLVAVTHDETLRTALKCDEVKIMPKCLVSCCGPYDLVSIITSIKLPFDLIWDMGHCLLDSDTFQLKKDFSNMEEYEHIKEISPINWVNEKWGPTLLVMASEDFFCKGQGELLEKKLQEIGVLVDTYKSKKLVDNHCFHLDMYKSVSRKCFNKIFDFLDDYIN